MPHQAVARFAGSARYLMNSILGLVPQALFYRPLRGLGAQSFGPVGTKCL